MVSHNDNVHKVPLLDFKNKIGTTADYLPNREMLENCTNYDNESHTQFCADHIMSVVLIIELRRVKHQPVVCLSRKDLSTHTIKL